MLNINDLIKYDPFSFEKNYKKKWYFECQKELCKYHYENCAEYSKITDFYFDKINSLKKIEQLPFIHSSLFKDFNIRSTKNENITLKLSSSGTRGKKSNIFLDKNTSFIQSRTLNHIYSNIIKKKIKIFFIDNKEILNNSIHSARSAAIKGFFHFVKDPEFILDKKMNLEVKKIQNFVKKNPNKNFIIFGFTSIIYEKLLLKLERNNKKYFFKNATLIHGGGWKKLENQSISRDIFYNRIQKSLGINKIHNYYGMIEQIGSIFIECEEGFFHCSNYSDILIRGKDLKINDYGIKGLIQIFSLLPISYPGHNILTEDVGAIFGEDDCKCKRKGKYFKVYGRVADAELRGCSDVY